MFTRIALLSGFAAAVAFSAVDYKQIGQGHVRQQSKIVSATGCDFARPGYVSGGRFSQGTYHSQPCAAGAGRALQAAAAAP